MIVLKYHLILYGNTINSLDSTHKQYVRYLSMTITLT